MTRVAVLGGGTNSAVGRAHVAALRLGGISLDGGLFSRHEMINNQSAAEYGRVRALNDFEDLIDFSQSVDAVVVLTPTPQHFIQVTRLREAGVRVICEKAIAQSSRDAKVLQGLNETEVDCLPVLNYSGYPLVREIRERVRSGSIGGIHHIRIRMPQEGFSKRTLEGDLPLVQEWRLHDADVSTVSLDLGVHLMHLVWFILGRAPDAWASLAGHVGLQGQVIDYVLGIGRDSLATTYALEYGKVFLGYRNGLEIEVFGQEGALHWIQVVPDRLVVTDSYGTQRILNSGDQDLRCAGEPRYQRFKAGHPTGFIEALANMYEDMSQSLDSGSLVHDRHGPLLASAREAYEDLVQLERLERAARRAAGIEGFA